MIIEKLILESKLNNGMSYNFKYFIFKNERDNIAQYLISVIPDNEHII